MSGSMHSPRRAAQQQPGQMPRWRQTLSAWSDFCAVAPSPELNERLKTELEEFRASSDSELAGQVGIVRDPRWLGFNDGVILPPEAYPDGIASSTLREAALERAPLRGPVRVAVILADFSDAPMTESASHFNDLFF